MRRPLLTLACTAGFVLPTVAGIAEAAWPHDPNVGNVALCTAAGDQNSPAIVSDGAGGAVVAWQDFRSGTNTDIYAQRVKAAGALQWTASGVALCTASGNQISPMIVSDGAGGAIVTWQDLRSGTNFDLYAQRVNAAGVPQWTVNGVALCTAASDQYSPAIVSDGAGGAIVTWYDNRGGNYDIYAQRVNAAGTPQWTPDGVALCATTGSQDTPAIASDGAGGAIVTWEDGRAGTDQVNIYAQRINAAGTPQWTANGVALCTATDNQVSPRIASDGGGGAIVCWEDGRVSINLDIYAQRVDAAGVPQWTSNGVALCNAAGNQVSPTIAPDGTRGAIVAWRDFRRGNYDAYAQRVNAAGAPLWTLNGVALCAAANNQDFPAVVSDSTGGAIVAWEDTRNVNDDIYAQRVIEDGELLWGASGAAISTAASDQIFPTIDADGAGGAIVAWADHRNGSNYQVYAQRVERFGYLGNPEPTIASALDVPNDQGDAVNVVWSPSYLDASPDNAISSYWIWRSVPPNLAAEAIARGADPLSTERTEPRPGVRTIMTRQFGAQSFSWEFVGSVPAAGSASYSFVVPTVSDSVAGSNPLTGFLVEAIAKANAFWDSAPDSGYSVDNLPPAIPTQFTGAYAGGATHLHWDANHEADLAGYRLYRGTSSDFVPGPGSLIVAQPDTGFSDVGVAGNWYKLSAVDVHGNESLYQILGPGGTLDAPGTNGMALSFAAPAPNPVRGTATFRFGLPSESEVTLSVFDQQGRRVRELAHGVLPAGDHTLRWDGRDGAGQVVASGIYFARLAALERTLRVRFAVVR